MLGSAGADALGRFQAAGDGGGDRRRAELVVDRSPDRLAREEEAIPLRSAQQND